MIVEHLNDRRKFFANVIGNIGVNHDEKNTVGRNESCYVGDEQGNRKSTLVTVYCFETKQEWMLMVVCHITNHNSRIANPYSHMVFRYWLVRGNASSSMIDFQPCRRWQNR